MLSYRPNKTSTTLAAYRGEVRVGYVVQHNSHEWGWALHLLRPTGGHHVGIDPTSETAKLSLQIAFKEWLGHAQLMEKT